MRGYQSFLRASAVPWLIILGCCLCSRDGIDHGQYLKWASAIVNGDIQLLENKQGITSVTGIPFSPWSAGPGLLIAPIYLGMSSLGLQQGAGLVTGYVCVAIFWLCLFKALKEIADPIHATLGCLLMAIGTPVGFYCSSISSETYALAPTAFLFLQTVRILKQRDVSIWGIACATAVLFMIRSFLAVFAWPALFAGLLYHRTKMSRAKFILTTSSMIGLAILQVAMTNSWMTGHAFHSPYSFGDEFFRSINWTAPFLYHVLLDPFHGLIPSHPLVALGILCIPVLVGVLISRKKYFEASIWAISLISISANIYVQSCWFYWWLAAPSFGMRGLVLCSVPAVVSLIRIKCLTEITAPRFSQTLWLASILLGFYGWLHLEVGPTNCVTFFQLTSKLLFGLSIWQSTSGMIGIISGLAVGILAYRSQNLTKEHFQKVVIATLLACFVGHTVRLMFTHDLNLIFIVVCIGCLASAFLISCKRKLQTAKFTASTFKFAATAMFVGFTYLSFTTIPRLQQPAETKLVFNRPDARRAFLSLREIPRFHDQANDLYEFFARTQDPNWVESKLPLPIECTSESSVAEVRFPENR